MDAGLDDSDGAVTPLDHAWDQVSTALQHLIKVVEDGGSEAYDVSQLLGLLGQFERARNQLS